MLSRLVEWVKRDLGLMPPLTLAERIAQEPLSLADSPDEIIAASLIQSIAKDFDKWEKLTNDKFREYTTWGGPAKKDGFTEPPNRYEINRGLFNREKKIAVYWQYYKLNREWTTDEFHVNDIPFPEELGRRIVDAFDRLKEEHDKVAEIARKAAEEMARREKAWDFAENLLGLCRNEQGALVPKESVECFQVTPPKDGSVSSDTATTAHAKSTSVTGTTSVTGSSSSNTPTTRRAKATLGGGQSRAKVSKGAGTGRRTATSTTLLAPL